MCAFYGGEPALSRRSISSLTKAASRPCSAPTAPARRRRCARSAAWSGTRGEVRFDGKPLVGRATEDIVRLGIAHVPEGRGTFVRMTVEENLQLGAMARRDRAGIATRYRAGLWSFPAAQGAPRPARRHPERRRAADAGGRPRPDAAAAADAARRAVVRSGAADRRGIVRRSCAGSIASSVSAC